jgi:hypothetical protein
MLACVCSAAMVLLFLLLLFRLCSRSGRHDSVVVLGAAVVVSDDDHTELQRILDNASPGGIISLSKDYRNLDKGVQIWKPLTLLGNGHSLILSPTAGVDSVIVISSHRPNHFCNTTAEAWTEEWSTKEPSLQNVNIKNLKVYGNWKPGTIDLTESPRYKLREYYCQTCQANQPLTGGLEKNQTTRVCGTYKTLESAFSWDSFGRAGVTSLPSSCSTCASCILSGHSCKYPGENYLASDIRASAIVLVHAGKCTLTEVLATQGSSAGISAFFGCSGLTLDSCSMWANRYDGFGPDNLKDAVLTNCIFPETEVQEKNAAISVSAGTKLDSSFYGTIRIDNARVESNWAIGLYCNSPNIFEVHNSSSIQATKTVQVTSGLLPLGAVHIAQPCKGKFQLDVGLTESYSPEWCSINRLSRNETSAIRPQRPL